MMFSGVSFLDLLLVAVDLQVQPGDLRHLLALGDRRLGDLVELIAPSHVAPLLY